MRTSSSNNSFNFGRTRDTVPLFKSAVISVIWARGINFKKIESNAREISYSYNIDRGLKGSFGVTNFTKKLRHNYAKTCLIISRNEHLTQFFRCHSRCDTVDCGIGKKGEIYRFYFRQFFRLTEWLTWLIPDLGQGLIRFQ